MLIYKNKNNEQKYIFIHVPKNAGKYFRNKIKINFKIIKSYWGVKNNFDFAHIPYIKLEKYVNNIEEYNIHSYTRNPYDRIISAFFYKNKNKNIKDFQNFCKNQLLTIKFTFYNYNAKYIHYYPQYLFLYDDDFTINVNLKKIEDIENPKKYILSEYFDHECLENINKIYEKDFELFGYDKISKLS